MKYIDKGALGSYIVQSTHYIPAQYINPSHNFIENPWTLFAHLNKYYCPSQMKEVLIVPHPNYSKTWLDTVIRINFDKNL